MKQLEPDLWQTSRRVIDDTVGTHAYLLIRPTGNLLLYGIGEGQDDDSTPWRSSVASLCRCSATEMNPAPR